jgi:hypothetical protein
MDGSPVAWVQAYFWTVALLVMAILFEHIYLLAVA